jgi:uncharacterized OB-fold protein
MTITTPIDDTLFTVSTEDPQPIGGECGGCGAVAFPRPWTVQRFRPKEPYTGPEPFEPYGVGYVELPDGVIVESRLTTADPNQLEPFGTTASGEQTVTYAFRPVSDRSEHEKRSIQ